MHLADGFSLAFESAAPSFHLFDLAVGVAGAVALRLMVYCKSKNAKKYRRGVEYGSARWGGPKDIAPYIDPVFDNNILLTQTERLTMNNRPKDPKTARNKNVLVIGGSGSGKTRFFVNLICLYHNTDRRRTAANLRAALPDMDREMAALACQTADKLDAMSDADFAAQRFHFTDE